jgi:hypothetical protein
VRDGRGAVGVAGVGEEVGRVGGSVVGLQVGVRGKLAEVEEVAAAVVVRAAIRGAVVQERAEYGPSRATREVRGQ